MGGVLAFELMTGRQPFDGDTPKEIVKKVRQGMDKVQFPLYAEWPTLVQGLCKRIPTDRLPLRPGGFANLANLMWFRKACFNWDAHSRCLLPAPYVPSLGTSSDMSNFDPASSSLPQAVAYVDPGTGWDRDFEYVMGPASVSNRRGNRPM